MKSLLLVALALALAAKVVVADNPPAFDPAAAYVEAFQLIQDGEQAVTRADWPAAWERFTAARESLGKLKAQAPDWQAQMVDFRLRYCAAQLAEIAPKLPPSPPGLNVVITAPPPKRDTAALTLSPPDLPPLNPAELAKLEAALAAAQAEAAAARRQAEELAAQNRALSEQLAPPTRRGRRPADSAIPELRNRGFVFRAPPPPVAPVPSSREDAALRAELQKTRAELAASREVVKEAEQVKRENRELRDQIADLRKQLTTARQPVSARPAAAEVAKLETELRLAQETAARQQQVSDARIAELVRENAALKLQVANPPAPAASPELAALRTELQQAQAEVARLRVANADQVTALEHRNQELQTQLAAAKQAIGAAADPTATARLERELQTTQATLARLEQQRQSQVEQLHQRNAELNRQLAAAQQAAANPPPARDTAELARLRRELSLAKTEATLLNRAADRAEALAKENAALKVELATTKRQREPIDQRRLRAELESLQEIATKNTELLQRLREENAFLKNLLETHTARNPELKGQLRRLTPRE